MKVPTEAEIRRLAGEVRRLWKQDRPGGRVGGMSAAEQAEGDRWTDDYRAAVRALLSALLAYPGTVQLDDRTILLPNADGDGPAFVPDPEQLNDPREAYKYRQILNSLRYIHDRRHHADAPAPRRRA
jgi:hypothetical protein